MATVNDVTVKVKRSAAASTRPVVIIGAGIQGCATAFFLSQRGQSVIVLDKDDVGRHASGVNAGGVRRLGRDINEIPLSLAAMDWWHQIDQLLDIKDGFHQQFYVKVALDDAGANLAGSRIQQLEKAGFKHEIWVEPEQLHRRIPHLTKSIVGGVLVEGDGWALPWRITRAFYEQAVKLGAEFRIPVSVQSVDYVGDHWQVTTNAGRLETDNVINCAGAWGAEIAKMVGDDMPVTAHAPMLVITDRQPMFLDAVIGVMGGTLSLKQLDNGSMVIGGGMRGVADPAQNKTQLTPVGLSKFVMTAGRVFSHLRDVSILRAWAGIEGYTADNLPFIGRGSQQGIIHGFGFSAHGFQLGPGVGEVLADLVMARQPRVDISPFAPHRFSKLP